MYQTEVPISYKPNISVFFRADRNCWNLTYLLPSKKEEVKVVTSLPSKRIDSRKKALTVAKEKEKDLNRGILTKKEYQKLKASYGEKRLTFDEATVEFFNLPESDKRDQVISSETKNIKRAATFFEDNFKIHCINDVSEVHVLAYKSYLQRAYKDRIDKEKEILPKIALLKDEEAIWKYSLELKKSGIAPSTARSYFRDLRTLFNQLYKHKVIQHNPFENVEAIAIPKSRKARSKTYSISDVVKILSVTYEHQDGFPIKEFFELLLETGARVNELLYIEWHDLDLIQGVLHIREKPYCPTNFGLGFSPKTSEARAISLSSRAIQLFEKIPKRKNVVAYIRGDKTHTPYPGNYAFTCRDIRRPDSPNFGGWCRPNDVKNALKNLFKKAGLPFRGIEKLNFHDARRFKNNVEKYLHGKSVEERSKELGHSPKVNAEHYSPRFDQSIVNMSEEINSLNLQILRLKHELEFEKQK